MKLAPRLSAVFLAWSSRGWSQNERTAHDTQADRAYVDAAATALDLRLRPDHRAGVLRYFGLAAEFAIVR